MAKPVSKVNMTIADHGSGAQPNGEQSTAQFWITTIIAGNYTTVQTAIAALAVAVNATQIGVETKRTTVAAEVVQGSGPASSGLAQRENKWLLRYHDSTTDEKFTIEIPCADLTLLAANSEFMDQTLSAWTGLKTAFEALVLGPNDSGATVLDSAQFVGRNL